MRAKDLAKQFNETPSEQRLDLLCKMVGECVSETRDVALARGVKTDSAMKAVIREVDDKWRAFARQCPGVHPDGFKMGLHHFIPPSKELFP